MGTEVGPPHGGAGGGGGGGGTFSAGISGGNTAGNTGTVSNQLVLAGGNNITLSGSTGAGGMTATISAFNQSVQTQNVIDVSLSGSTSGALALISSGTMILCGGNNVILSQNGQSVTISAFAQTAQTQNVIDLSISGNTAGVPALISSGTAILAGGNNITLSQNGQSITISANAETGAGISIGGNSTSAGAGYSNITTGTAIFAGGNNITLSQNGASITISQNDPVLSYFEIPVRGQTNGVVPNFGNVTIQPFVVPYNLSMYRMQIIGSFSSLTSTVSLTGSVSTTFASYGASAAMTNAGTMWLMSRQSTGTNANSSNLISFYSNSFSFFQGLSATITSSQTNVSTATFNVTTSAVMSFISQIDSVGGVTVGSSSSSASQTVSATQTSNNTGSATISLSVPYNLISGVRPYNIPMNTSLSPGEYWLAFGQTVTTASTSLSLQNVLSMSTQNVCFSTNAQNFFKMGSQGQAISNFQYGWGSYNTSGNLTSTIAMNQISAYSNVVLWFNMMANTL